MPEPKTAPRRRVKRRKNVHGDTERVWLRVKITHGHKNQLTDLANAWEVTLDKALERLIVEYLRNLERRRLELQQPLNAL